jgi:uncharacterized Tic20 family protein
MNTEHTRYGEPHTPPAGETYSPPAGGPYIPPAGRPYPPPRPTGFSSNETLLAGLAHLSVFVAPIVAPLLIWLLTRDSMPYASRQGKQAFIFHLAISIIASVVAMILFAIFFFGIFGSLAAAQQTNGESIGALAAFPIWFFLFFGAIAILGFISWGFSIYGAVQAFQGKPFSYLFMQRL